MELNNKYLFLFHGQNSLALLGLAHFNYIESAQHDSEWQVRQDNTVVSFWDPQYRTMLWEYTLPKVNGRAAKDQDEQLQTQ